MVLATYVTGILYFVSSNFLIGSIVLFPPNICLIPSTEQGSCPPRIQSPPLGSSRFFEPSLNPSVPFLTLQTSCPLLGWSKVISQVSVFPEITPSEILAPLQLSPGKCLSQTRPVPSLGQGSGLEGFVEATCWDIYHCSAPKRALKPHHPVQ